MARKESRRPPPVKHNAQRGAIAVRTDLLAFHHHGGHKVLDGIGAHLGTARLGPCLFIGVAPPGLFRLGGGLARNVDLHAVDLDVARGDDRGDAAIPLDLRDQPRRAKSRNTARQRQRGNASHSRIGTRQHHTAQRFCQGFSRKKVCIGPAIVKAVRVLA
jgi:hypothetical protein